MRVWTPACSTGEEPIRWPSYCGSAWPRLDPAQTPTIQIFATDIDKDAIDKARQGVFAASIAADVSPDRLERFFLRDGDHYRVKKEIREMVIFAAQNMLLDPPFTRLDILCCRNFLIYVDVEAQRRLVPLMHYALNSGGLLILGTAETVGSFGHLFLALDKKWKIFERQEGAPRVQMPAVPARREPISHAPDIETTPETTMDISYDAQRALFGRVRAALRGRQQRWRYRLHQRANRQVPGTLVRQSEHQRFRHGPPRIAGRTVIT